MDIAARVTAVLEQHPSVERVEPVGSRARGDTTPLSDWDFHIHTSDPVALMRDLPTLAAPLEPLAAQWDRLVDHAAYMLVLPGPVKIDLVPEGQPHEIEPPWKPEPSNLAAIDAHFWDWVLWLGSKSLHQQHELVEAELRKLHDNLLGPLGVATAPTTIDAAVTEFRGARDRLEHQWNISIDRRLGDEVSPALQRNLVIDGR
jgi:predicted nucleotidyltransferase